MTAGGYGPGTSAPIYFLSTPVLLTTVTADGSGVVRATVTIPANAAAGAHTIEVRGTGANGAALTRSLAFSVVSGLPRTGNNLLSPALWASVLLVLGAASVLMSRVRMGGQHFG